MSPQRDEVANPQVAQLAATTAEYSGMLIEIEPWGGMVVRWSAIDLSMLVDWTAREYWVVWRGRPLLRAATILC